MIKIDLRFTKKSGPYGPFNDDTLIGIDIEIYRHPTIEKLNDTYTLYREYPKSQVFPMLNFWKYNAEKFH